MPAVCVCARMCLCVCVCGILILELFIGGSFDVFLNWEFALIGHFISYICSSAR